MHIVILEIKDGMRLIFSLSSLLPFFRNKNKDGFHFPLSWKINEIWKLDTKLNIHYFYKIIVFIFRKLFWLLSKL